VGAGAPPSGDTTDAEGTDWAHHGTGDGLASGEVPKGAADVSGDSKNGSSSGPLTRGKGTATTAPAPTATTPLGVGLPSAPGTSGTPPKVDLVPFSFLFDGKATIPNGADDHTCLSYDPALAPPDRPAVPLTKTGLTPDRGHFVDHCPSENLVATCDQNALLQRKTFFYRGRPEPMFAVDQNVLCAKGSGKWTWLVAPGIPKPPPDPGPFSSACNLPTAQMCIEILPAADQTAQMMWGGWCKRKEATAVAHCPTQGMTGRCDAPQVQNVTIYHYERDTTAARTLCLPGAWSAP
jgi:hypothetical protein